MSSDRIHPAPATSPTPSSPSSAEPTISGRLASTGADFHRGDDAPVEWRVAKEQVGYEEAVLAMERHVEAIRRGAATERVWLVEHPALLTAGTGTGELPTTTRFPVHRSGRGGQLTYHGPGQRVAYVMLDLGARRPDLRAFVAALERWLIDTLAIFEVRGERREERVGVWVVRPDKPTPWDSAAAEDKIAAIGIRVRRWVSFHGVALNVEPDLGHYDGIVPCGIADAHLGQTSLAELGRVVSMAKVDMALRAAFEPIFGPTRDG